MITATELTNYSGGGGLDAEYRRIFLVEWPAGDGAVYSLEHLLAVAGATGAGRYTPTFVHVENLVPSPPNGDGPLSAIGLDNDHAVADPAELPWDDTVVYLRKVDPDVAGRALIEVKHSHSISL